MKGICYKEPLFHATIEKRKEQTRRIMHIQPIDGRNWGVRTLLDSTGRDNKKNIGKNFYSIFDGLETTERYKRYFSPKYKVGDVVYLKEPYCQDCDTIKHEHSTEWIANGKFRYKYNGDEISELAKDSYGFGKWKNKLFMPASAARYFIKIVGVRAERLQDISDEDCLKEGIFYEREICYPYSILYGNGFSAKTRKELWDEHYGTMIKAENGTRCLGFKTPQEAYASLINKISGKDTWDINPFVWVYDFALCNNDGNLI